ncbi:MAG: hypothetical protein WAM42_10650 [Candidatus Nitrosopolaris sp.]
MNTMITTLSVITGVIAAILLFAAGPLVPTHQVLACGGWDGGCFTYGGGGTYTYGGFGFSSSGFGGW